MYGIIYLNWSGSKEEFGEATNSLKKIASKFDDVEFVNMFIPSSEWNYAALIKFKEFETFLKYVKATREEPLTFFAKRGLKP
ncbi:MAG: hypothetical protein ACOC80_11755, partial [Petrotogales bacterium]